MMRYPLPLPQRLPQVLGRLRPTLFFDGVDDKVDIGDYSAISNIWDGGGMVEFWCNPFTAGASNLGIPFAPSGKFQFQVFSVAGGKVRFQFMKAFSTSNGAWNSTTQVLPLGRLSHLALVYNADDVANDPVIYLNGQPVALTEALTPAGARTDGAGIALVVGNGSTRAWHGYIDEVRIWGYARSQAEIQRDMHHRLSGLESGLAGYWRMDEWGGKTVRNQVAGGSNGSIVGATWYQRQATG